MQKFLKRYTVNDIPPTKFQVLNLLYEEGPMTSREMILKLGNPSVCVALQRYKKEGLVKPIYEIKMPGKRGRSSYVWAITEAGISRLMFFRRVLEEKEVFYGKSWE